MSESRVRLSLDLGDVLCQLSFRDVCKLLSVSIDTSQLNFHYSGLFKKFHITLRWIGSNCRRQWIREDQSFGIIEAYEQRGSIVFENGGIGSGSINTLGSCTQWIRTDQHFGKMESWVQEGSILQDQIKLWWRLIGELQNIFFFKMIVEYVTVILVRIRCWWSKVLIYSSFSLAYFATIYTQSNGVFFYT